MNEVFVTNAEELTRIIQNNFNSAARSFIAIGYYLKQARDTTILSGTKYKDVWDYAMSEFGLSKSSASRYMDINSQFSKNGNSLFIQEEYKDFKVANLQEMLYLTAEQRENITPVTTVKEIREIKKRPKLSAIGEEKTVRPDDSLIKTPGCGNGKFSCFSCGRECDIRQDNRICRREPLAKKESCTTVNVHTSIKADIGDSCMFVDLSLAPIRAGDKEPSPCCQLCVEKCGYACSRAVHELIQIEPEVDCKETGGKVVIETVATSQQPDAPEEDIIIDVESEEFSEEEERLADSNDSESNYSTKRHLENLIKHEEECIEVMKGAWKTGNPDALLKHETMLLAYKSFLTDIEYPDPIAAEDGSDVKKFIRTAMRFFNDGDYGSADFYLFNARKELADNYEYDRVSYPDYYNDNPKPQPELPKMKNNDQRKAWIDGYEDWPVWIELPQTKERYYRYDFSNGSYVVIKVYFVKGYQYGYGADKEDHWGSKEIYLVKSPIESYFKDCETNTTVLVEYLKELQKK